MVTPDFEDWLERQDIPIEETIEIETYQDYLKDEMGIHGGSLEVAADVWEQKYNILPQLGVHSVERHYEVKGEPFTETRWGITGYPGLWGRERMYDIVVEKAEYLKQYEWVGWLKERRERSE